jgi:hypothetical protein
MSANQLSALRKGVEAKLACRCKPSDTNVIYWYLTYVVRKPITRTARTTSGRFWQETGKTGNKPPENPPETSLINVNYVAWLCRKMNGTESEGKQSAKAWFQVVYFHLTLQLWCASVIFPENVNDALSTPFIICNTVASGSLYHNKINWVG